MVACLLVPAPLDWRTFNGIADSHTRMTEKAQAQFLCEAIPKTATAKRASVQCRKACESPIGPALKEGMEGGGEPAQAILATLPSLPLRTAIATYGGFFLRQIE